MGFDEIEQIIRKKTIHDPEVKSLFDKIEKGKADVVDRCKLYMRQLELLKEERERR